MKGRGLIRLQLYTLCVCKQTLGFKETLMKMVSLVQKQAEGKIEKQL